MFLSVPLALLAALSPILASSAPTIDRRETNVLSTFKERFAEASASELVVRQDSSSSPAATCNLATAQMPTTPSGPLPPPSAGLALTHIAIGRGTQNYTCGANATAPPTAIGATATLFNVTCLAGPYPSLLSLLPDIALKFPVPDPANVMSPANLFLSGHHFFQDTTTPVFNLNTTQHEWGSVACKKVNATTAPNPATDVPWLKLQSKAQDGCTISEVYRVNTRGGQPPATCSGQPASFQVQYAAEYWMWSAPGPTQYGS